MISVEKIIQCHKGNSLKSYKTRADDADKFVDNKGKFKNNITYLTYK
jgi:hypothetical protein